MAFKYFFLVAAVVATVSAYDPSMYYKPEGAPIGYDGKVMDTPEVAMAKAQHFAAVDAEIYHKHMYRTSDTVRKPSIPFNKAWSSGPIQPSVKPIIEPKRSIRSAEYNPHQYQAVPLVKGIYLRDTPEVEHAREEHFMLYDKIAMKN